MASGGDRTPEYCCVLKNMTCIIDHLKTNEDAKERLIQKLQQKRWIDIPCKSKEHELVRTALNRIKDDANEYYAFIDMLQNITGMDVVVKKMNVEPHSTTGAPSMDTASLTQQTLPVSVASASTTSQLDTSDQSSKVTKESTADMQPTNHDGSGACTRSIDAVKSDIEKLKKDFKALKNATRNELEGIAVDDLVDGVTSLPARDKEQHKDFLKEYAKVFENCKSTKEVFYQLNSYWDYFNWGILDHIITEFSLDSLESDRKKYKDDLEKFMDYTMLDQLPEAEDDVRYEDPPQSFVQIVSSHELTKPVTVKKMYEFRKRFAHKYALRSCAIYLLSMRDCTVVVTMLVPCSVKAMIDKEMISSSDFEEFSLVHMELNGITVFSQDSQRAADTVEIRPHVATSLDICDLTELNPVLVEKIEKSVCSEDDQQPRAADTVEIRPHVAASLDTCDLTELNPVLVEKAEKSGCSEDDQQPIPSSSSSSSPSDLPGTTSQKVKETKMGIEQECDFVKEPSKDFFCPVTQDLLLEPHLSRCCGHHFSAEAVAKIQEVGGACPTCKNEEFLTVPDKYFRRQVHQLRVFCCHKERGCEWKGELSALNQHIQSCLRKNSPVVKDFPLCLTITPLRYQHIFLNDSSGGMGKPSIILMFCKVYLEQILHQYPGHHTQPDTQYIIQQNCRSSNIYNQRIDTCANYYTLV